jgi:hypothetical protein
LQRTVSLTPAFHPSRGVPKAITLSPFLAETEDEISKQMYIKRDLTNARRNQFIKLGITDDDDMLRILNFFDAIAEIGYRSFKNKQLNSVGR